MVAEFATLSPASKKANPQKAYRTIFEFLDKYLKNG
jgi:hypothetical protein